MEERIIYIYRESVLYAFTYFVYSYAFEPRVRLNWCIMDWLSSTSYCSLLTFEF